MAGLYNDYYPLIRILKISLIGVADFGVGLVLATLLNQGFEQLNQYEVKQHVTTTTNEENADTTQPFYNWTQLKYVGLVSLAQLVTTLIVGMELRNLFIPYENFLDPTGGIVFVLALFFQPGLWLRSRQILTSLYRLIWQMGKPKESETGNQS
jgi:hypothetical protein